MARTPRIHKFNLDVPVHSKCPDVLLNVSTSINAENIFQMEVNTLSPSLAPERFATVSYELAGATSVTRANLLVEAGKAVESRTVRFSDIGLLKSTALEVAFPEVAGVHRVECRPPEKVSIFKSPYLDNAPISREMLDLKHISYKTISEFVLVLAERSKTNYTNVKLIGVFDPVPLHLAKNLTIDTTRGILKYFIRKDPIEVEGRRIVRIVYGRLRTTGEIVSAVLPVT